MSIRDLVPSLWHGKGNGNNTPFPSIETLREEMDQLFDQFNPRAGLAVNWNRDKQGLVRLAPADISETDKEIEVTMDLAGFDEKDIDITFADGHLTIEGKREDNREEDGKNYHRLERSCGSFRRSFYLPSEIEEDSMEARFAKGVLKITLPKSPEAQKLQKKIEIKTS